MTYRPFDLTGRVALVTERITNYYSMRTVLGVPIWENRLRIAARTLI